MSEENTTTTTTTRSNTKLWISVVIGALMVIAGGIGVFQTETVNNQMISIGAEQSAVSIIEMYPNSDNAIAITANTIDAAVQARNAKPDELAILISEALNKAGIEGKFVKPIITMVIDQLNEAYKKSETEDLYLAKAQALADGLRAAVPVKTAE